MNNMRILYKKTGKMPQIKYITDILPIKKLIITGDLDLVKFEKCIIVCNNRKKNANTLPNIVLDLKHISGDFFLIGYDSKKKDFIGLDMDEAIFYMNSLQHKSFQHKHYKKWLQKQKDSQHHNKQHNEFIEYQKSQKKLAQKLNAESEKNISCNSEILKMILSIQAIILNYIKKQTTNNNFLRK